MTDGLVVSFHMLDAAGDELGMVQFSDVPIVPAVGEPCLVVTSRDGDGNYSSDGKPQRRWDGTVIKREFSCEIHGRNSAFHRATIYVDVYVDCAKQLEAEAAGE